MQVYSLSTPVTMDVMWIVKQVHQNVTLTRFPDSLGESVTVRKLRLRGLTLGSSSSRLSLQTVDAVHSADSQRTLLPNSAFNTPNTGFARRTDKADQTWEDRTNEIQ